MAHDEQEEFQRYLLLRGEPIYSVGVRDPLTAPLREQPGQP